MKRIALLLAAVSALPALAQTPAITQPAQVSPPPRPVAVDPFVARLRDAARADPRIRLVENGRNLGFAAGNNAGIAAATGEYVLLLNNDTYVAPGAIAAMVAAGLFEYNFGDSEFLMLFLVLITLPYAADRAADDADAR